MISLIWAMDKKRGIGKNNSLPWKLPADMKRFVSQTKGKIVVMGRKTFESIGKPLPNRENIILTTDKNYKADGCKIVHSVEEILELSDESNEIMVIGGAKVYAQFLPHAETLYLTKIKENFDCDAFFPKFDATDWVELENIECDEDENNPYQYRFITLQRKA